LIRRKNSNAVPREVLKDCERLRHCGKNAQRKIAENFSMKQMTDGYATLYCEICGD